MSHEFDWFLIIVSISIAIYKYPIIYQIQLTLEQHGFELYRSTYSWIFFNKYSKYSILILQIFKLTKYGEKFVFN